MRDDRSGISTLLIAVVIVVIVVVAAGAAYVVLSDDKDNEQKETLAPGTVLIFDITVNGEEAGTLEQTLIGQSSDVSFFMLKTTSKDAPAVTQYNTSSKNDLPEDLELIRTTSLDTKDGVKTVQVFKFTITSAAGTLEVLSYIDPENNTLYKEEITGLVQGKEYKEVRILKEYEPVWQTSYKESKSIGKTSEYVCHFGTAVYPSKIKCIADCLNDQYGVAYDFSSLGGTEVYFLSDNIQGLPTDAINTGKTELLRNTIDGDVTVEVWTLSLGIDVFTFYYEPDSHTVYKFMLTEMGYDFVFDLTKKPK